MKIVRVIAAAFLALPAYGLFAYVVLPASWKQYARLRPFVAEQEITHTAEGIPGDPLNVALVGTRAEVLAAMLAAGWTPADPITLRSGIRDAASVLFHRPYPSAPLSTHFLRDRPQDLAFEQIVGGSPRRRHHVRLWQTRDAADAAAPLWVGAATFDRSVGLSRYTGEVMHHIDADVDAEREKLIGDLRRAGRIAAIEHEAVRAAGGGTNGSGDRYVTDGRRCRATLRRSGPTG